MGVRLTVAWVLLCTTAWAAAPPAPWSKAQKDKLAERDRLEETLQNHFSQKQYDKAIELAWRVLQIEREVLGETDIEVVGSWRRLAGWYEMLGQFADALKARGEVLRLQEMRFGKGYWESTDARLALEDCDRRSKMTAEQKSKLRQASTWHNLSSQFFSQGKVAEAFALTVKVRDIREEILGQKHPDYANSLNNLAFLHKHMVEYEKALVLYNEALQLREALFGKRHPAYATTLNNLASLYLEMGESAKALPLVKDSLQIREETLGKRHAQYATSLNNLAMLYRELGEYSKALPLLEEAAEICEEVLGKQHPNYAHSLSNLALLHESMNQGDKAIALFTQVVQLHEKAHGKNHSDYVVSLSNLATVYFNAGERAKALPLCKEALQIGEGVFGKTHPDYARGLNNLALVYRETGESDKAMTLLKEGAAIRAKTLGKRHPDYADILLNQAALYRDLGKVIDAVAVSGEALAVLEHHLDDGFDHLGERQRNQILQNVLHNLGIHLSLQEQAQVSVAQRYLPVLAWKGRVAIRSTLDRLASDRPELKETLQKLRTVRTSLARLILQIPEPSQQVAWLNRVEKMTEQKETLEAEVSRRSAEFRERKQLQRLSPDQLAKQLPEGVAFVDLIEYSHYFTPKDNRGKERGEQRFLAFVSRRGEKVEAVSLGAAKPVADVVARWRAAVEKKPSDTTRKEAVAFAAILRQRVWDKVAKHISGAKTVVVAPDGALCQFPLAALPGSRAGTYLIEDLAVIQVASAAQLFELLQPVGSDAKVGKGLLAVGGIDYGHGEKYKALPATGPEARRCRELFATSFDETATLLEGSKVTPKALSKEVAKRPRYLHFATHGYFEPADMAQRALKGFASRREELALRRKQTITLSNLPGLRCGLALSGANQALPPDDPEALPNVLTALDLEGIDLRGCEVAVLSACQTALGDVEDSQGVLGLQRAFHAAGVRTTVTSLWSVQDAATAELMEEFYKRLWGKQKISRIEALRQAQIAILRDPERVRKRTATLIADAKKRGDYEELVQSRGIERFAVDVPEGDKSVDKKPTTSPEAWWAAFVLSGDWR